MSAEVDGLHGNDANWQDTQWFGDLVGLVETCLSTFGDVTVLHTFF